MALQEELESQGNWLFKYRGILPIIILVIGAWLYVETQLNPNMDGLEEAWGENTFEIICLAVSLFGLGIRIYTVGHTPANTSGRNTESQLADTLNTTGIYSTVRHPLYIGNFFMWLGIAFLTANLWFIIAFILLYMFYYERIMFAEEQFLRKKFGDIYLSWAGKTPAILPKFGSFVKSKYPFSWKKIIKNEKTGLLLSFLIFAAFDFLGELAQGSADYNCVFMCGFIISVIAYILIKILKKYTSILNEEGR